MSLPSRVRPSQCPREPHADRKDEAENREVVFGVSEQAVENGECLEFDFVYSRRGWRYLCFVYLNTRPVLHAEP